MTQDWFRPVVQCDPARPRNAVLLAGGWGWFTHIEHLRRDAPPDILPADACPQPWLDRLATPRPEIAGLQFSAPTVMGILNVTPDSFSDGGQHNSLNDATNGADRMAAAGADILDVGGESTRPGADYVPAGGEIKRTAPVIAALKAGGFAKPVSIDTRKAAVAEAALSAGADLVNDVSGFTHDAELAPLCARLKVPVCVMHAQGDPATMQDNPVYGDVVLDVFDFLETRIAALEAQGIPRTRIIADPGIGFGKRQEHNLALLQRISLLHGLGVPILLGASRKRFIGSIGNSPRADARMPGSVAVALAAIAQGVQTVRVHDVAETTQALALWKAVHRGY